MIFFVTHYNAISIWRLGVLQKRVSNHNLGRAATTGIQGRLLRCAITNR